MNIVLIGYRGTGKSVVGAQLAKELDMPCISMDAEIVIRAGRSIPQFVEQNGWNAFRDLETLVARTMAAKDNTIVDCGGGVIERQENIEALKVNGLIFWLRASVDVIVRRIESGTERPALIKGKTFTEEVAEVLERRTPMYAASCHHEIDTDSQTPQQTAAAVIAIWQEKNSSKEGQRV